MRWQLLAKAAPPDSKRFPVVFVMLWSGMMFLSLSLVAAFMDGGHISFAYAILTIWAAVASVFFMAGFLSIPTPGLLVLPVGALAVLIAIVGGFALSDKGESDEYHWVTIVHMVFMTLSIGMVMAGSAAGGLYFLGSKQLKSVSPRALRLPSLSKLARLNERALIIGTGLLLGGMATGSIAMRFSEKIDLTSPAPILSGLTLVILTAVLGLHMKQRQPARVFAFASFLALLLMVIATVSMLVDFQHG